jgi:hypothetical protein
MRGFVFSLLATSALALAAPSTASAQAVLEVEGTLRNLVSDGAGGAIATVMGVQVAIPAGTPVSTPTASLTVDQLLDPTLLPGRDQPGFLGGTAIITGTSDLVNGAVAADVFVEPSENVVLGLITGTFQIENMPFSMLQDPRMPALPIMNVFGFEIDPASLTAGTPAAAEGYYSALDQSFHAFIIETEGGTLLNAGVTEVSILRAQCRNRNGGEIELEVRGSTHDPATGQVAFTNTAGTVSYGSAAVVQDAEDPTFGSYVFRIRRTGLGACPSQVVASFSGATASGAVAIR